MQEAAGPKKSYFLSDFVIGISDGLIIPFALLAGMSGAVQQVDSIQYVGLAAVAIGAIAMGVSAYLTGKEDRELYYAEMDALSRKSEKAKEMLTGMQLSYEVQRQVISDIEEDKLQWRSFLQKFELVPGEYTTKFIRNRALNIGMAYAMGGLLPLLPYMVFSDLRQSLYLSVAVTLPALLITGFIKGKVSEQNAFATAGTHLLKGGVAALAAYCLAMIFR